MTKKIKTAVDDLIKLLKNKNEISIEEASRKLKISVEQIEEWAKVLEEKGFLEIEYSPFTSGKIKKVRKSANLG